MPGTFARKWAEVRDAIVFYREALKIDPDFPEALLESGPCLSKYVGSEEEARTCWRKAIFRSGLSWLKITSKRKRISSF